MISFFSTLGSHRTLPLSRKQPEGFRKRLSKRLLQTYSPIASIKPDSIKEA